MNFQSPQGAPDAAVAVPTQEDGTVLFDMPLSSPCEEERLARQLEYHQWPDRLELECSEQVDFDRSLQRSWGPWEEYLPEGWAVDSQVQMEGNCTVFSVIDQEPRIVFSIAKHLEGMADLDLDWKLEALSGYRPERCYLWGGIESQRVSIDRDGDHRDCFYMQYALPNYNDRWALVDHSWHIPGVHLRWQEEWQSWSPLRKDAVDLPDEWADMTEEQRALWWYRKSSYFDCGEPVSIGPAQYEGVVKLTLADDSFLEVTLDEDGFLTSMYGPYPPGSVH